MPHTLFHRLAVLAVVVCAGVVGVLPGTASAHNTLVSSDPADGAELSVAPTQITWVFANPVPLETMTVTLIDATGARSELSGSTHASAGETEVVTPLPTLAAGPASIRWRLVGPDGHPITGRIDVSISTPAPDTTAPTMTVAVAAPPSTAPPTTEPSVEQSDTSYSTPGFVRWVLRYTSHLAIMAIVGILATSAYVWSGAVGNPRVRRILARSLFATAVLGFLQLLVVASDVSGKAPWSALGSIDPAMTTDAGRALTARIVLAVTLWLLLFRSKIGQPDVYWTALGVSTLGLLATWAFAGHSRSMRWPTVGVATDVVHHAAAAAWIAGLAIVGWIVIPKMPPDVLVPAVRRFSRMAAISVTVLVVTGLVQTVRLVGTPMDLLDANHGRYLAAKVAVLAGMLVVANANRRRIDHRLDDPQRLGRLTAALRQAIVAEFAIGLVIIAITAAMVVAPPSSSASETGAGAPRHQVPPYTTLCSRYVRKVHFMMRRLAIVLALTATVAACGSDDASSSDTTTATVAKGGTASVALNEADTTFAQGMIAHHEQAIEMAEIALDPTVGAGPEVVDLATRIKAAQDPEVELMTGWLTAAGEPMAMDSSDGHDMSSMDGMMTADEMDSLSRMTGTEFDQTWLDMMIAHHEGAISQSKTVKADGSNADVLALADRIITAQQAEITEMKALLGS